MLARRGGGGIAENKEEDKGKETSSKFPLPKINSSHFDV